MTKDDIDSLQRQSRLVKPSRYPSWFPEGAALIRVGLAGATAGVLVALLAYALIHVFC